MNRTTPFSRAMVALYLLALTGCNNPQFVRTEAPDVHVAPECKVKCTCNFGAIANDPINGLMRCLGDCDNKRQLCVNALDRSQKAGAIK